MSRAFGNQRVVCLRLLVRPKCDICLGLLVDQRVVYVEGFGKPMCCIRLGLLVQVRSHASNRIIRQCLLNKTYPGLLLSLRLFWECVCGGSGPHQPVKGPTNKKLLAKEHICERSGLSQTVKGKQIKSYRPTKNTFVVDQVQVNL